MRFETIFGLLKFSPWVKRPRTGREIRPIQEAQLARALFLIVVISSPAGQGKNSFRFVDRTMIVFSSKASLSFS